MNYDYEKVLADVVNDIRADKSIMQPWKNKAMARIQEAAVFVDHGKKISLAKPPEGLPSAGPKFPTPQPLGCICQPDMPPRKDCPVHGRV
jgi:hypothetical protein